MEFCYGLFLTLPLVLPKTSALTVQTHARSYWCGEEGGEEEVGGEEGENVHLKTHATARGVGKKLFSPLLVDCT